MSTEQAQVVDSEQFIPLSEYEFLGNSYTVERKRAFIEAYREEGSIYHAAQVTRVARKTVYNWIEIDPQFAEAFSDSKEDTYDKLETSVYRRAFSDNLLAMFYLKAHRPKFRDKVQVDVSVVQDEINGMMNKLGTNLRQLPVPTTEFIDTSFNQSQAEYQPVTTEYQPATSHPDNQQKEESSDLP